MKFSEWIIFIVSFTLTDAAPAIERPSSNLNFTKELNNDIAAILKFFQPYWNGSFVVSDEDIVTKFNKQSTNNVLYNTTIKFERWPPSKAKIPPNNNDNFTVLGQLKSVFLEGYLRDSNHHIVTEKFTLNYVVTSTISNEVSVDFPNFESNEIKLLAPDHHYKPNEEIEIKKEIKTHLKATFNEFITVENKDSWNQFKGNTLKMFEKISHNDQERYYFIGTIPIPSANYTLNNVTINGLWNARSNTFNVSNLEAFPEIEIGSVKGSMVRNFHSTSEDLSFKADTIYISVDRNISKVNVKAGEYSVVNNELNTSLPDDQSKLIIREIESAFAASLEAVWKTQKQQTPF